MSSQYIIYRFEACQGSTHIPENLLGILKGYTIEYFHPNPLKLKDHVGSWLLYLFWYVVTMGKYQILYVRKDHEIIHYTHILPKFFKFPFLSKKDYLIGPSWTAPEYRGKGLFPAVLYTVVKQYDTSEGRGYIFAHDQNLASQKGIQKAGFIEWNHCYKTGVFGIYRVKKKNA